MSETSIPTKHPPLKEIPVGPLFALVDEEDFEFLNQFTWSLIEWQGKQYAKRKQRLSDDKYPEYGTISMHSMILKGAIEIDHMNGDGLDNRKENLREVTHKQNLQGQKVQRRSKSGYRGVSYFPNAGQWKRKKPWRARIKVDGNDRTIGYYETPEQAAEAWNKEAFLAWGKYASLNDMVPQTEERR